MAIVRSRPMFPDLREWFDLEPFEFGRVESSLMRVEQFRDGDTVVVRAEMPGVDPDEDVDITVDGDLVTIRAERREEKSGEEDGTYRSEFHYGRFERRFRVADEISVDEITATYDKGILEIRVPTKVDSPPEPKKVKVTPSE